MGGKKKKENNNVERQVHFKLNLILLTPALICNVLISFATLGARDARLCKILANILNYKRQGENQDLILQRNHLLRKCFSVQK